MDPLHLCLSAASFVIEAKELYGIASRHVPALSLWNAGHLGIQSLQ